MQLSDDEDGLYKGILKAKMTIIISYLCRVFFKNDDHIKDNMINMTIRIICNSCNGLILTILT